MDNYIKSEMDENDDDYDNDQVNSQNAEPVEKNYSSCRTNKDIKQYEIFWNHP